MKVQALLLSLAVACGAASAATADNIDDFVTTQLARQHIPGASIAVLKNGKAVKVKGYGYADLESEVRATPETVYEIGSVSKQFIAAGIVLLSRDGKLNLNDSVRKYIDDAPESWQPITVRHLLTHTSGLLREAPNMQLKIPPVLEAIRASYAAPLVFKPGENHAYSNVGYFTLAEIITRASGMPWSQFIAERIFTPLGMNATRTTTFEDVVPRRAAGYVWADDRFQHAQEVQGVRPSGAFLSTVGDLAKWDAALYSDAILKAPERALMWTAVKLNDGSTKNYGFGWEVASVGEHRRVRHGGTMLGYRADISRYVDDSVTVIVLSNSGQGLVENVANGLAARYVTGLQPVRKAVRLPVAALEAFMGKYQIVGGVLTVWLRDGQLVLTVATGSRNIERAVLTPAGKAAFFDEDSPRTTYSFEVDPQGKMHFVAKSEDGKETMRGAKL